MEDNALRWSIATAGKVHRRITPLLVARQVARKEIDGGQFASALRAVARKDARSAVDQLEMARRFRLPWALPASRLQRLRLAARQDERLQGPWKGHGAVSLAWADLLATVAYGLSVRACEDCALPFVSAGGTVCPECRAKRRAVAASRRRGERWREANREREAAEARLRRRFDGATPAERRDALLAAPTTPGGVDLRRVFDRERKNLRPPSKPGGKFARWLHTAMRG